MFLFKSSGSRHSLTFFLRVDLICGLCHLCDNFVCNHLIQFGFTHIYYIWSRGGWTTGLGLSISWMWYLLPGNLPILSKQSLYSSTQWMLKDSSPRHLVVLWGYAWGVQDPWMFTDMIPSSCASWPLIMDGWPWASTVLKLAETELLLKVVLRVEVSKLVMVFPP